MTDDLKAATAVDEPKALADTVAGPSGPDSFDEPTVGFGEFFRRLYAVTYSKIIGLIIILAFALLALAGAVFIQASPEQWQDPAGRAEFMTEMTAKYGGGADLLAGLGLFHVFNSVPFYVVTIALAISITGCTSHRVPALWQGWRHPRVRVSPRFFQAARYQASLPTGTDHAAGLDRAEAGLKAARYRVIKVDDQSLYADKFAWGGFGTVASHLSFLVILAAFLISGLASYSQTLRVPVGGNPVPVADTSMSIAVLDYNESYDAQTGAVTDYVSDLVLYQDGQQVARQEVRVNWPLARSGWLFYQFNPPVPGIDLAVRSGSTTVFQGGLVQDYESVDQTMSVGVLRLDELGITIQVHSPISGLAGANNSLGLEPGQVGILIYLDGANQPDNMTDLGTAANIDPGTAYTWKDLTLTYVSESQLVGIRVRTDPGTIFVWIGGILLVLGMTVTFTCRHRRVWLRAEDGELLLASADKQDTGIRTSFDELVEHASTWYQTRS